MKTLAKIIEAIHYAFPYGRRWIGDIIINGVVGLIIFSILKWVLKVI